MIGCLMALLLVPAAASAQRNRIHFEASGGVYMPDAFGISDQRYGWTAGARVALPRRSGTEFFVHFSYAAVDKTDRTGVVPDFVVTGIQEQLYVAGADLPVGGTVRFEIAVGPVLRRNQLNGIEGTPDPSFYPDGNGGDASDWTASPAAVPGISYRFADRLVVRVRDLLILDDALGRHSLSLGLGIAL
jgi:hypothetical protein